MFGGAADLEGRGVQEGGGRGAGPGREGRQCPHPERSEEGGEGRLGSLHAQELEGVANESGLDNSLVTRGRGLAEKGGRVVKGVGWGVCRGGEMYFCPREGVPFLPQAMPGALQHNLIYLFIFKYLFIWLCRVLVAARGIFVAACGIFSCSMQALSCGMHVGSSFLTRNRTWAPCIGSTES